jgi:hypothetical protein
VKSMCAKLEREIASAAIKIPMAPSMPSNKVQSRRNPVILPPESGSHNEMHNLVYGRISDEKDKGAVYAGI